MYYGKTICQKTNPGMFGKESGPFVPGFIPDQGAAWVRSKGGFKKNPTLTARARESELKAAGAPVYWGDYGAEFIPGLASSSPGAAQSFEQEYQAELTSTAGKVARGAVGAGELGLGYWLLAAHPVLGGVLLAVGAIDVLSLALGKPHPVAQVAQAVTGTSPPAVSQNPILPPQPVNG